MPFGFTLSLMSAPKYVPLKPKIVRVDGRWRIFLPQTVFGDLACGGQHGPFASWEDARRAAFGIATALHANLCRQNQGAIQIGAVN